MPVYISAVQRWGFTKRSAKTILELSDLSDATFWRILRGDDSHPNEVSKVELAIIQYGRKHKLPGHADL